MDSLVDKLWEDTKYWDMKRFNMGYNETIYTHNYSLGKVSILMENID